MKDAQARGILTVEGGAAAADHAGLLRRQQVRRRGRFPRLDPDPRHEDVVPDRRLRPARRDLRLRPHRQQRRVRRLVDPDRRREDRRGQHQLQHPPDAPVPEDADADRELGRPGHVHRNRLLRHRRRRAAHPPRVRADRRQEPVARRADVERVPGRDGLPGDARLPGPARHDHQPPPAGPLPPASGTSSGRRSSRSKTRTASITTPAGFAGEESTPLPGPRRQRALDAGLGAPATRRACCATCSSTRTSARARANWATA